MNQDAIIQTINSLFSNLFSSIDNSIYSALDNIAFIDINIFNNYYIKDILNTNGLLLISN